MNKKEVIKEISALGFVRKNFESELFELNKGKYRFFVHPKTLYLQVYATRDGSNAEGRGFLPGTFKQVDHQSMNSLKELKDVIDGF